MPITLKPSPPVQSSADGQVIEGLDIVAKAGVNNGDGIRVLHNGVIVRNNRIKHGLDCRHGIAVGAKSGVVIEGNEVTHTTPNAGKHPNANMRNINCDGSIKPTVRRNRVTRGSAGIYFHMVTGGGLVSFTEGYDFRGPMPRGQLIQIDKSPDVIVEDFTGIFNDLTSWVEDCLNIYYSPRCIVRRGLLMYNNSPSGIGVIVENSPDCVVEDVDTLFMHNGNFSASASSNTLFNRVRARDQRMKTPPGGRAFAKSGEASGYPLIFHSINSSVGTRYRAAKHFNCGPNLLYKADTVVEKDFTQGDFTPRKPIQLLMAWEDAAPAPTPTEPAPTPTEPAPTDPTLLPRLVAVEGRTSKLESDVNELKQLTAEMAAIMSGYVNK